jgi:hypothetical protein
MIDATTTAYMPDGNPCPTLMTEAEMIRFLRLDTIERLEKPEETLKRYVTQKKLRPTKVSGRNFFTQRSALEFLQTQTKE